MTTVTCLRLKLPFARTILDFESLLNISIVSNSAAGCSLTVFSFSFICVTVGLINLHAELSIDAAMILLLLLFDFNNQYIMPSVVHRLKDCYTFAYRTRWR